MIQPQLVKIRGRGPFRVEWCDEFDHARLRLKEHSQSFFTYEEAVVFADSLRVDLSGHMEYVYCIRKKKGGTTKFGFTANITRRFENLQQGTHANLVLAFCVQCKLARWKEYILKTFFSCRKIRGEWFFINSHEIESALRFCLAGEKP